MISRETTHWKKFDIPDRVKNTKNKIRAYVETELSTIKPPIDKKPIILAIGDPVIYPDFRPDSSVLETLAEGVDESSEYTDIEGSLNARKFIAELYSTERWNLDANDVILQAGGSGGLWSITTSLADPGDVILTPAPGFPLIATICEYYGIQNVTYQLTAQQNWEIDLKDLEEKMKMTPKPKMLLVNNPSNPLGNVWSEEHIQQILQLANRYTIPILADEIYERMVLPGRKINSFGKLSQGQPVFVCSGTAKMCLVPGWRMGWVVMYGEKKYFNSVKKAMKNIIPQMGHPSSIIQWKLPEIWKLAEPYLDEKMIAVEKRAKLMVKNLDNIKGISFTEPQGAMYGVLSLDLDHFPYKTDKEFSMKFYEEEAVMIMPGELFNGQNIARFVTLCSEEVLTEFSRRLRAFCERHYIE